MKQNIIQQKRMKKQAQLLERLATIYVCSPQDAHALLATPLRHSVRINPLRQDPNITLEAMKTLGWTGEAMSWTANCYTISEGFEALRDSALAIEGAIYLQNASSWLPVIALDPQPHETILDMCAAPGGKTAHIAAITNNQAALTVNDNSKARLMKLQRNLERLNVRALHTLIDATTMARHASQQFDKILLDAPCSGEGLITLTEPKSFDSWSVAHIRRLASLQRQLIHQAWQLLKPGGRLVYSTCTNAPEENEMITHWLLRRHPDAVINDSRIIQASPAVTEWNGKSLNEQLRLCLRVPASGLYESFFVATLEKPLSATSKKEVTEWNHN